MSEALFDRFDLTANPGTRAYKLLAALVVPRPIALVTTMDAEGCVNAAPISFFNLIGSDPAMVVLAPSNRPDGTPKDTARNLIANGEAVVHICDEAMAARMVACAAALPPGVSELEKVGLVTIASERVRPPRIQDCPVALECRVVDIRYYGENRLVVLEALLAHVRAGLADTGTWRVKVAEHAPIGRMESPDGYVRTRDRFQLPFPD
ncbi:MAG TPA: flavin reductase family protein [Opitutae bacterium]|nr:flavin reductase family protein [Opitutae bacterium]